MGSEKASRFILLKCFDEPPSTTYDAKVKGAPTKPRTAASLLTWQIISTVELTNSECINNISYSGTFSPPIKIYIKTKFADRDRMIMTTNIKLNGTIAY